MRSPSVDGFKLSGQKNFFFFFSNKKKKKSSVVHFQLKVFAHLVPIRYHPNIVFVFNGEEFPSKVSPSLNTLGNFQTSGCMAVMPQDLFSLKETIE